MDSLRSLGALVSYDGAGEAVTFCLPVYLPFSATSVLETMSVLAEFADGRDVTARFTYREGMVIRAALTGPAIKEAIELMSTALVPLEVRQTERDRAAIDLLHVEIDTETVMMDPAQALTVSQLKQFILGLPQPVHNTLRGQDLVRAWHLTVEDGGYFALGTARQGRPVLGPRALSDILRPKYGTHSVDLVELIKTGDDDRVQPMLVRAHIRGMHFESALRDMADRLRDNLPNGFSRVMVPISGYYLQMVYEGDACRIGHPQKLGATMHTLLKPVFDTIGVFPAATSTISVAYHNPENFRPASTVQTSAIYIIPVVSDR